MFEVDSICCEEPQNVESNHQSQESVPENHEKGSYPASISPLILSISYQFVTISGLGCVTRLYEIPVGSFFKVMNLLNSQIKIILKPVTTCIKVNIYIIILLSVTCFRLIMSNTFPVGKVGRGPLCCYVQIRYDIRECRLSSL